MNGQSLEGEGTWLKADSTVAVAGSGTEEMEDGSLRQWEIL